MKYEREINKICKKYGVLYDVERNKKMEGGVAFPWESQILLLYTSQTPKNVIFSILFHEIAHVLCYRSRKYVVYNGPTWDKDALPSKIAAKHFFNTALKAELEADRLGKELMAEHYPKMKFVGWYQSKRNQKKFLKRIKLIEKTWERSL